MRDLLASRLGRLVAFFLLYVTEGIPLGFTAVAIATQMRRRGLSPAEIGLFVASLYLPWGWKWVAGPFVDLVGPRRLGRRRVWIVTMQSLMAVTMLAAVNVDFVTKLTWFTWLILLYNAFAATMDVAIDALAVTVLPESERGLAGGLMFAGAYLGNAVGGAGVLFLTPYISFNYTFFIVAAAILAVTFGVSIWLREPRPAPAKPADDVRGFPVGGTPLHVATEGDAAALGAVRALPYGADDEPASPFLRAVRQVVDYVVTAVSAIFGSRAAVAGLVFALLPHGAMGLSLALASNLSVELGLTDARIATLSLVSTIAAAAGCVGGGFLSDRFGRRRMITLYILCTAVPTLIVAAALQRYGVIWPAESHATTRPASPAKLLQVYWAASIAFSFVNGLIYGTRTALFMDLCSAKVAGTQFTAYMALMNLVIAYTAYWQGRAIERFGFPTTLLIDAGVALICLAVLPFMAPRKTAAGAGTSPA